MNSENFAEYLDKPAKLYQLPYQEIKNLVAEYPYAANLRLMMFIKSKIEQDPSFETHLHKLSAHTFDRDHLFDLYHHQLKEMLDLATGSEERLELHDLHAREEKELLTVDLGQEQTPAHLAEAAIPNAALSVKTTSPISFEDNAIEITQEDAFIEELTEPVSPASFVVEKDVTNEEELSISEILSKTETSTAYQLSDKLLEAICSFPLLYTDEIPQIKTHFSSWRTFRTVETETRIQLLREKAKQSIQGFPSITVGEVAAKSVQQKPNVATETLAKLLERQGSPLKAIKMYEQLSLLSPEKSRYFAAIIEKLKQNI